MTVATSLIPGLDEIVRNGDPKRRAEAARRIAELYLQGAANYRADHVELFDGILIGLVPHAELAARADLAERLSILANAPRGLVGQLAREDEIAIAGPLLRRSPVIDEQGAARNRPQQGPGSSAGDVGAADACLPISPMSWSAAAIARWCGAPRAMRARFFRMPDIPV